MHPGRGARRAKSFRADGGCGRPADRGCDTDCGDTIYYRALGALSRPSGEPDRSALPIASDDPVAKTAASRFLDRIGCDTVDAGPLTEGWRFEVDAPAHLIPYVGPGGLEDFKAAGIEEIRARLAEATR